MVWYQYFAFYYTIVNTLITIKLLAKFDFDVQLHIYLLEFD